MKKSSVFYSIMSVDNRICRYLWGFINAVGGILSGHSDCIRCFIRVNFNYCCWRLHHSVSNFINILMKSPFTLPIVEKNEFNDCDVL